MVLMPTGGVQIALLSNPALIRPGVGIVISPLIALMQDQVDAVIQLGIRAAFLHLDAECSSNQRNRNSSCAMGQLDLLYIAPEQLNQPQHSNYCNKLQLPFCH